MLLGERLSNLCCEKAVRDFLYWSFFSVFFVQHKCEIIFIFDLLTSWEHREERVCEIRCQAICAKKIGIGIEQTANRTAAESLIKFYDTTESAKRRDRWTEIRRNMPNGNLFHLAFFFDYSLPAGSLHCCASADDDYLRPQLLFSWNLHCDFVRRQSFLSFIAWKPQLKSVLNAKPGHSRGTMQNFFFQFPQKLERNHFLSRNTKKNFLAELFLSPMTQAMIYWRAAICSKRTKWFAIPLILWWTSFSLFG